MENWSLLMTGADDYLYFRHLLSLHYLQSVIGDEVRNNEDRGFEFTSGCIIDGTLKAIDIVKISNLLHL